MLRRRDFRGPDGVPRAGTPPGRHVRPRPASDAALPEGRRRRPSRSSSTSSRRRSSPSCGATWARGAPESTTSRRRSSSGSTASKHTYEPKAKVGTWIYRITVNTCLNEIRRLARRQEPALVGLHGRLRGRRRASELAAPLARSPTPRPRRRPERLAAGEVAARVRAAIDRLPEQQRLAVVLSRYHGLLVRGRRRRDGDERPRRQVAAHARAREPASVDLAVFVRDMLPDSAPAESGRDSDDVS